MMLSTILIIVLALVMATVIVAAVRKHDANNYFDQDRQPFYAEPEALVEHGLLYSQRDRDGAEKHSYTITPAGEAGLRAWLREPTNDPGLVSQYFEGLLGNFDPLELADRRRAIHAARQAEYERIEDLLVNRPEWRYALAAARAGTGFEKACIAFWERVTERHSADKDAEADSDKKKED